MDTPSVPLKQCSRKAECVHPERQGDGWLPATAEHFRRHSPSKDGLNPKCKACMLALASTPENREKARQQAQRNRDKPGGKEQRAAYRQRPEVKARARELEQLPEHREKRKPYFRQYYQRPEVKARGSQKRYKQTSPRYKEYARQYQTDYIASTHGKEVFRIARHRRVARKRDLPDTFTVAEWRRALEYFNGCCAVCGRQLDDLFDTHTVAADHWIPLSSPDCPGTVAANIIPLCHGVNGCNNKKRANDPIEWIKSAFGERKGRRILARIQTYFDNLE